MSMRASAKPDHAKAEGLGGAGEATIQRHQRVIDAPADRGMQGVGRPQAEIETTHEDIGEAEVRSLQIKIIRERRAPSIEVGEALDGVIGR